MRIELQLVLWSLLLVPIGYRAMQADVLSPLEIEQAGAADRVAASHTLTSTDRTALIESLDVSGWKSIFQVSGDVPPTSKQNDDVTLKGILLHAEAPSAVFQSSASPDVYVVLRVGQALGDWTVTAINKDRVAMGHARSGEDRIFVLRGAGEGS